MTATRRAQFSQNLARPNDTKTQPLIDANKQTSQHPGCGTAPAAAGTSLSISSQSLSGPANSSFPMMETTTQEKAGFRPVVLNLGSRDPLGVPNANLEYQQISPIIDCKQQQQSH